MLINLRLYYLDKYKTFGEQYPKWAKRNFRTNIEYKWDPLPLCKNRQYFNSGTMTIWQMDQRGLQATLKETHLTRIPQNLLWNGKAPGLVSKTQSKVDLPSLTLPGPSISAPLASSAYTCLQLRGLRLQGLPSGNIHLGTTSAEARVHRGQKSFYLWAGDTRNLASFRKKKITGDI